MNKSSYWLDLFAGTTWGEFKKTDVSLSIPNRSKFTKPTPPYLKFTDSFHVSSEIGFFL